VHPAPSNVVRLSDLREDPVVPNAQPKPTVTGSAFWNLDFKSLIPVILFLVAQMIIGATWIGKIDSRLTMREAMVEPTMKRLDRLEADRDAIIRVQEQLKNLAVSIEKLDVKLDKVR
jgi:hypothetical protein